MTSSFKATCCGWRNEAQNVRTLSQVRQRFQVHVWSSPFYFLALTLRPHHEGLEEAVRSIGISLDCFIYWGKEGLVEGGNLDVAWNICIYNVPQKKHSGRLGKECGLPWRTALWHFPLTFLPPLALCSWHSCPQGQCVSGKFLALPGCTEEDSDSVGISNSCGPNASGFPWARGAQRAAWEKRM